DVDFWKSDGLLRHFNVVSFTEGMRCFAAASCWIELEYESAAMWRLYAPGKEGVAVATSFEKLLIAVNNSDKIKRDWLKGAASVRYINHFSESLIRELSGGQPVPNTMMPFMLKNISYEHEKEVRALICALPPDQMPAEGFNLPLNISEFVDAIVVNPFC